MKRPSFQFYPDDWTGNSNLRRCTHEEKGIWMDVLCILHDQEEYGIVRWPLAEIAQAVGVTKTKLKRLVDKGVLKGIDAGSQCDPFIFVPRSGRKDGAPVTLIEQQDGPLWYSSRMVLDEYKRKVRGGIDDTSKGTPDPSPKGGIGADIDATPKHASKGTPDPSPLTCAPGQASRAAPSSPSPSPLISKRREAAATPPPRACVPVPAHEATPPAAPPDVPETPAEPPEPPRPPIPDEAPKRATQIVVLLRRNGADLRIVPNDRHIAGWVRDNVTDAEILLALETAKARRQAQGSDQPIGTAYLAPIIADLRASPPDPGAGKPAAAYKPWICTWSGIVAKGAEFGLKQEEGEPAPDFKARVIAAANLSDEEKARLRADFGVSI